MMIYNFNPGYLYNNIKPSFQFKILFTRSLPKKKTFFKDLKDIIAGQFLKLKMKFYN